MRLQLSIMSVQLGIMRLQLSIMSVQLGITGLQLGIMRLQLGIVRSRRETSVSSVVVSEKKVHIYDYHNIPRHRDQKRPTLVQLKLLCVAISVPHAK
jgi:hypothetical protein